jgi:hypothetical protein
MVAAIALAVLSDWSVFPETVSPSGVFGVAWRVPGKDLSQWKWDDDKGWGDIDTDHSETWLVKEKDGKALFRLKGLAAFPHENHGGILATYSVDERYLAAIHAGKWEPRAVVVADTRSGKQTNPLPAIRRDASRWLKSNGSAFWKENHSKLVYDIIGLKFVKKQLELEVNAQVPKLDERGLRMAYVVNPGPSLRLVRVSARKND